MRSLGEADVSSKRNVATANDFIYRIADTCAVARRQ
jgi:hypothetical protein